MVDQAFNKISQKWKRKQNHIPREYSSIDMSLSIRIPGQAALEAKDMEERNRMELKLEQFVHAGP